MSDTPLAKPLSSRSTPATGARRLRALGVLAVLVFSLGLFLALGGGGTVRRAQADLRAVPVTALSALHVEASLPGAHVAPGLERAADGLPIMPADPEAPVPAGPVHPHPITPAHERIYRENNLVAALNLAVDLRNPERIHTLVAQYRSEYPQDEHVLQEGYEIIADCLDKPDAATRARARRFWETQIRSQTRRYVRRHCRLEPRGVHSP